MPQSCGSVGLVLDAAKGNPDHDLVPVRRQMSLRLVDEVRDSGRRAAAPLRLTLLNPVARTPSVIVPSSWMPNGLTAKTIACRACRNGRQDDLDVVVAVDLVAIGERRMHGAVRFERADPEVDRRRAIPDQHLGRVVGGAAVNREVLGETGEHRRLLPDRGGQRAVDRNVGGQSRQARIEVVGPTVVNRSRRARSPGRNGRRRRRLDARTTDQCDDRRGRVSGDARLLGRGERRRGKRRGRQKSTNRHVATKIRDDMPACVIPEGGPTCLARQTGVRLGPTSQRRRPPALSAPSVASRGSRSFSSGKGGRAVQSATRMRYHHGAGFRARPLPSYHSCMTDGGVTSSDDTGHTTVDAQ